MLWRLAKKLTTGTSSPNTGWSDGGAGPQGGNEERQCRQMPCVPRERERAPQERAEEWAVSRTWKDGGCGLEQCRKRETEGKGSGHTKPGAIGLDRQGSQTTGLGMELEAGGGWALCEAGAAILKVVFHRGGWVWMGSDQRQGCRRPLWW